MKPSDFKNVTFQIHIVKRVHSYRESHSEKQNGNKVTCLR